MARKSIRQRNAEQRVRQQRVRDDAREHRRLTRDDVARALLWQMIVTAKQKRKRDKIPERLCIEVTRLHNIDYREVIHACDDSEGGITTFTDRGIESLKEFLADIRTWDGGVRQFLVDEQCDPEKIECILADEPKS